jgi:hypothetical protein
MSTRRNLRRKVVLALHVVRRSSGEKQLAHTLDITESSARLGGLNFLLEPGEVIEIRRGPAKARFEVVWMGAPGSSLDGQTGLRCMEPGKNIWGVDLPEDQKDLPVNVNTLRSSAPQMPGSPDKPAGRRAHERYPCSGSASIKTAASSFPLHGEVKDVSEGGIYVELTSPMAVNTDVTIGLKIEGAWIEFAGNVRTSYPLVGMGIAFRKLTPANLNKLTGLLRKLQQRESEEKADFVIEFGPSQPGESKSKSSPQRAEQPVQAEAYPLRVLALACQNLANNFDSWKGQHSQTDIEELRLAVNLLQKKLSPPQQVELAELLAGALPGGNA